MVRRQSFVIFAASGVVLSVFLLIYKQATVTRLLYQQQVLEKECAEQTAIQARLTQQLFRIKNPVRVQEYAGKMLGMQKTMLKNIRRITKTEHPELMERL